MAKQRANGYGSIRTASDGRKKCFRVLITVGYKIDDYGKKKQIQKVLASFRTHDEAEKALLEYNIARYKFETKDITFAEVYEEVTESIFADASPSTINGYNSAFKSCESIHNMKMLDIKHKHLQKIINSCEKGYHSLRKIVIVFNAVFNYADKNDMIMKNYAKFVDIPKSKIKHKEKERITDDTIKQISELTKNNEYAQLISILIYSGVRIGELLSLKKCDINIADKYFTIVKSKNNSGLRKVPIADKILPFIEYWYNKSNSDYLFTNPKGSKITYNYFRDNCWDPIFNNLSGNFTPHATRHTTISLLAMAKVDERIIRRIVGHSRVGVTDKTYTHIDPYKLHEAINKI